MNPKEDRYKMCQMERKQGTDVWVDTQVIDVNFIYKTTRVNVFIHIYVCVCFEFVILN